MTTKKRNFKGKSVQDLLNQLERLYGYAGRNHYYTFLREKRFKAIYSRYMENIVELGGFDDCNRKFSKDQYANYLKNNASFKIKLIRNKQFNDLFSRIYAKQDDRYIDSIDIVWVYDGKNTNVSRQKVENRIRSFVASTTKNFAVTINEIDIIDLMTSLKGYETSK